jgi:hyperosmotically inducible periplasmic protein
MRLGRLMKTLIVMVAVLSVLSGCRSMTGKSAGTNIDDASITAAVKSKLVADKASNLTRVNVDTNNGTVYLNGTVETPEQRARAEQIAREAKGVRSVVNNLQLQKN